jgi:hypothetical protein
VSRYREDMRRAWDRINAVPAGRLETGFGTVEYAQKGRGVSLLVSHGVLGCHVDGVDGWWAGLPGPGFRGIAPSRFGYVGSSACLRLTGQDLKRPPRESRVCLARPASAHPAATSVP